MTMKRTRVAWSLPLLLALSGLLLAVAGPHASTRATAAAGLTVPGVERELLSTVSDVAGSSLSTPQRTALLKSLGGLNAQLQRAESLGRQRDTQAAGLDALLLAKVDTQASIDKIASDLQINLDQFGNKSRDSAREDWKLQR